MEEIEVIVSGRVQLVMYRDFTQRTATKLGISGTVENKKDGTVRVLAQGERGALETFLGRLKKGSLLSEVTHIEVMWSLPKHTFKKFSIIY